MGGMAMQRLLRITFRGMEPSDAVEARIQQKAADLERFYEHITSCDVAVELPHQHQRKGRIYTVRIEMHLPDSVLVVATENKQNPAHEDVYVAIRDAFDAAGRQLEDYVRKIRGRVKRHTVPDHGKVVRLYPHDGYGFVERSDGIDIYFHENAVPDGAFEALGIGDEVRVVLAEGEGEHGPQASSVVPLGKRHLVERELR
jgi:ribosomal subunit interface protein